MSTYNVSVLINGSAAGLSRAMQDAERRTRGFTAVAKAEFDKISRFARSAQGQLAGLGVGVGIVQIQRQAAQLDKSLIQVRLTAGLTTRDQDEAQRRMYAMLKERGGVMEDLVGGLNSAVQAGLKFNEAMNVTDATSLGRAVAGADARVLADALTVGAQNYGKNLAAAGVAEDMLDKMLVSGRMGNAELENMAAILPKIAAGSQRAGMSFETSLAFVQTLSLAEKNVERLGTLADSTTRIFTNLRYAADVEKGTGVRMFAVDGQRRSPLDVLEDLRKKYQALTTDAQRFNFMGLAFGSADLDTQRGVDALLRGDMLAQWRQIEDQVRNASGTMRRDLPTAINNAVDQTSRLKNALREAANDFAKPINDAVSNSIKYLMDEKKLSGGQLLGGAAAAGVGIYAASRFLPGALKNLTKRFGGVGQGVAAGKALEQAAGVLPVYVVNFSEFSGGTPSLPVTPGVPTSAPAGAGGRSGRLARAGWFGLGGTIAAQGAGAMFGGDSAAGRYVGSVGTGASWGAAIGSVVPVLGTAIGAAIGAGLGLAYEGVPDLIYAVRSAQAAQNSQSGGNNILGTALKQQKVGGEVTVRVLAENGLKVNTQASPNPGTLLVTNVGRTNLGTGF